MADLHEAMAASELASLAAFARAVLARQHSEDPRIVALDVNAAVVDGEIVIDGSYAHADGLAVGGFGL